jgi:hypothetical protein
MNEYISQQNLTVLSCACGKMLKDKYSMTLPEKKLNQLIIEVSNSISREYSNKDLSINELNNISLSKIKQLASNIQKQPEQVQSTSKTDASSLDDDLINIKLRELEARRRVVPVYESSTVAKPQQPQHPQPLQQLQQQPVSFTLPKTEIIYKTIVINSLNRDWSKNPHRNNLSFTMSLELQNYVLYPDCVCFPHWVRNMSPYVLLNLFDGFKNVIYTLVCASQQSSKWDVWRPSENVENINLQDKLWTIRFYDFLNNELDLGIDNISINQVYKSSSTSYVLEVPHFKDNPVYKNDYIAIRISNGKVYSKKIIDLEGCKITIDDSKNELCIADFINATILSASDQFSLIIKYHYKT